MSLGKLAFRRLGGGIFEISESASRVLAEHLQKGERADEAGGMLLGRHILDSGDFVVDRATTPQPEDTKSRYRFFRAKSPGQRTVNAVWHASHGTENYLGEWHTHPEDSPTPSQVDLDDWQRIARTTVREEATLFFLILGRREAKVWEAIPTQTEKRRPAWRLMAIERLPSSS